MPWKIVSVALFSLSLVWTTSAGADSPLTIEWTDLMSEEDLRLLEDMPVTDHGDMSDEELAQDQPSRGLRAGDRDLAGDVENAIAQAMKERTWEDALESTQTRPEFDDTEVRLAGFVVPLEFDDEMNISEFFLVPYFGACIHVPPPPPNQIIFVRYPEGLQLDELYTPYWVTGTLNIETVENETALAVYSMDAGEIVEYEE